jgi:hypothetical protein
MIVVIPIESPDFEDKAERGDRLLFNVAGVSQHEDSNNSAQSQTPSAVYIGDEALGTLPSVSVHVRVARWRSSVGQAPADICPFW